MNESLDDGSLDRIVQCLEDCRIKMTVKEALIVVKELCGKEGAPVNDNPEGGIVISMNHHTIHAWQVYEDIDRIYYEY